MGILVNKTRQGGFVKYLMKPEMKISVHLKIGRCEALLEEGYTASYMKIYIYLSR